MPFGQFANTNVGSVVEWDTTAAKQLFNDLDHDQPLPKSLITGSIGRRAPPSASWTRRSPATCMQVGMLGYKS